MTVKVRDLAGDPEAFRLETEGLEAEAQVAWDVMHTTGTSGGRPTTVSIPPPGTSTAS